MRILILCLTLCACGNDEPTLYSHYRCEKGIVMRQSLGNPVWEPVDVSPAHAGPDYQSCAPDGPL
jgi:hypothetical protein